VAIKNSVVDLFLFAGEPSADLHGEKLIRALLKQKPDLTIIGVGGPKMRDAGLKCLLPMEEFQVMGFIDVMIHLPSLLRKFFFIKRAVLNIQPKCVVTIDYPGFNLRMAKALRKAHFKGKLIHYICPSVWAWGKDRIDLMAKNLDLLLTIFPFEKKYFSHTSLCVEYVGNPLIKTIENYTYKSDFREKFQIPKDKRIIALFPGSRKKVIERNLPLQLKAAEAIVKNHPEYTIAISQPRHLPLFDEITNATLIPSEYTYELMHEAAVAIATSGTVTLELALHKTPTVVTYAVFSMDLFLAKQIFKINLPYYCIVNIIAEKQIFKELIGPNFTFENLLAATQNLLRAREQCIQGCEEVKGILGEEDASKNAAQFIINKLL